MIKFYYNLTTGLEYLSYNVYDTTNPNLVRIQSSHLEGKHFDKVIKDLDYMFLLDLAVGNTAVIIDGSVNTISRVIWQGLPWIEYTLTRFWLKRSEKAFVKKINCTDFFDKEYQKLGDDSKAKLRYTRKYLNTDKINLCGWPFKSYLDGKDRGRYKASLIQALTYTY
jgi:hypothetical protein